MKAWDSSFLFILHPSSFVLLRRRSQVVRQRSAKPLFIGSIPIAASNPKLTHTTSKSYGPLRLPSTLLCRKEPKLCKNSEARQIQARLDTSVSYLSVDLKLIEDCIRSPYRRITLQSEELVT